MNMLRANHAQSLAASPLYGHILQPEKAAKPRQQASFMYSANGNFGLKVGARGARRGTPFDPPAVPGGQGVAGRERVGHPDAARRGVRVIDDGLLLAPAEPARRCTAPGAVRTEQATAALRFRRPRAFGAAG